MEDETCSEERNDSPPSPNLIELDPKPNPKPKRKKKKKKKPAKPQIEEILIRDEVEFAKDDHDGRTQRYEERIRQGFCRSTFEEKIKHEKAAKEQALAEAQSRRTKDLAIRISSLQLIEQHLINTQDPAKELPNVQAIMAAYKNGDLEYDGKTTYWCQGKMIAGPSVFSWKDFAKYNTEENRGDGGFWVEGPRGPPRRPGLSLTGFSLG